MAEAGFYLTFLALGLAAYGIVVSLMGVSLRSPSLAESGERATLALAGVLTFCLMLLGRLFAGDDFAVRYVAEHSSRSTPPIYKLTAVWGGQAGSLLLWVWIQSLYASGVVLSNRRKNRELMPWVNAVLMGIAAFFLTTICFASNPFQRATPAPADGVGLNPLLQNGMMAVHPPTLYVGLVGFSVPFAFAMAALATGQLGDLWIRTTRRWLLFTWFTLGCGILLGSWWAYLELGWGGYWGWDPVENASLMPWLVGSAFLHSVMIQERRRMLKVWNIVLITSAFALCILGTFITRSGVISSVHSFAQSEVGTFFLFFLLAIIFGALALILYRLPTLRAENRIESMLSREGSFLFNNVLFAGLAFAVLWGTLFPVLSEWVRGTKITVTQRWFNTFSVPIGLALLILTGIGPLLAWRRSTAAHLVRGFRAPAAVSVLASAFLLAFGVSGIVANMAFTFCVFVTACMLLEFVYGVRARVRSREENPLTAFVHLVDTNKRRWGGYVVHLGMVLIFAGITGSAAFQREETATLARGGSFAAGPYTLSFREATFRRTPRAETHEATVEVRRGGRLLATLHPAREFFPSFRNQPASEVDILHTFSEDLYLVLIRAEESGAVTLKAYLNPLVSWIWVGGAVLLMGGFITMLPDIRERRYAVQVALEQERAVA